MPAPHQAPRFGAGVRTIFMNKKECVYIPDLKM
jgi:hypothetical protein